ncbi:MAG: hypothetical protein JW732_08910 [Dehalococcoidia bacterium]|nr:hypothetical protein [Dehalococcoidia bacterium]
MSNSADKLKSLAYVLAYFVAVLFSVAIVLYIIKTNFGEGGEPVGLQLATISAVIGGLVLASGFLNKGSSKPDLPNLALRLRRIGIMYLVATLAFVVFGICFPLIEESSPFIHASAIGMVVGALSFAMGSVLLAMEVPRLWSSS